MYVRPLDSSRSCGYVLTDLGAADAAEGSSCACEDLLVIDGTYQCRECGTVYGIAYGWAKPPRRSKWRHSELNSDQVATDEVSQ